MKYGTVLEMEMEELTSAVQGGQLKNLSMLEEDGEFFLMVEKGLPVQVSRMMDYEKGKTLKDYATNGTAKLPQKVAKPLFKEVFLFKGTFIKKGESILYVSDQFKEESFQDSIVELVEASLMGNSLDPIKSLAMELGMETIVETAKEMYET